MLPGFNAREVFRSRWSLQWVLLTRESEAVIWLFLLNPKRNVLIAFRFIRVNRYFTGHFKKTLEAHPHHTSWFPFERRLLYRLRTRWIISHAYVSGISAQVSER
jgi:hypothetical protein